MPQDNAPQAAPVAVAANNSVAANVNYYKNISKVMLSQWLGEKNYNTLDEQSLMGKAKTLAGWGWNAIPTLPEKVWNAEKSLPKLPYNMFTGFVKGTTRIGYTALDELDNRFLTHINNGDVIKGTGVNVFGENVKPLTVEYKKDIDTGAPKTAAAINYLFRGAGDVFEVYATGSLVKGTVKAVTSQSLKEIAVGKDIVYKPLQTKTTTKVSVGDSIKSRKVVKNTVYEVVENPGTKYYPLPKTATGKAGFRGQVFVKETPVAGQRGAVKYSLVETQDSIATKIKNAVNNGKNKGKATAGAAEETAAASGPFGIENEIRSIVVQPSKASAVSKVAKEAEAPSVLPTETAEEFMNSLKPTAANAVLNPLQEAAVRANTAEEFTAAVNSDVSLQKAAKENGIAYMKTSEGLDLRPKDLSDYWEKNKGGAPKAAGVPSVSGDQASQEAAKMGSDQGGLSDWSLDQIKAEDYNMETISIDELRKLDPDLDDYLNSGEIREYEGDPFQMAPIITSKGEVLDGYNRIAQRISDGETEIQVLRGVSKNNTPSASASLSEEVQQAYQMFTPNIREDMTFEDAEKALTSSEQAAAKSISQDVDGKLGLQTEQINSIGDTREYGVENSIFNKIQNAKSLDDLRYSAAVKGQLMKQKTVLNFLADANGPDIMYMTTFPGITKRQASEIMNQEGVDFRTLADTPEGVMIVIYDQGSQMEGVVNQIAEKYGLDIEGKRGTGEFVGSDVSREDAVREYKRVISEYEARGIEDGAAAGRGSVPDTRVPATAEAGFSGSGAANQVAEERIQSAMRAPLKGLENKPVTAEQVTQVLDMAASKKIPEEAVGMISQSLSGSGNLNELTQAQAYELSETLRAFEGTKNSNPGDFDLGNINRSQVTQARRWMSAIENEARLKGKSIPVYSQVWWPLTRGKQLADAAMTRFLEKTRTEVWGKYAAPQYEGERRMVTAYRKGDKDAILKNEELDSETKGELVRIADWYTKMYDTFAADKAAGTTSEKWLHFYSPEIAKGKGAQLYSKGDDLHAEMKSFYQFEREGSLLPLEDDAMVLGEVYANAFYRIKFMKDGYDGAVDLLEKLPRNVKAGTEDFVKEFMGMKSPLETDLIKVGQSLSWHLKGLIPEDITQKTIRLLMDNSYVGAMARVDVPLRQSIQILMNWVDMGGQYATLGARSFLKDPKGGMDYARRNGWLVNQKRYYGSSETGSYGKGAIGKSLDAYTGLGNKLMTPANTPDNIGRAIAVQTSEIRFNDQWGKLSAGQISWEEFEKNIDLKSFSTTTRNMVRNLLHSNKETDIIEGRDLMTREIIDRTQFPYRKGESTRIQYGLGGKMGLQWTSWTFELAQGFKDMVMRREWDKIARFIGIQVSLKRSVEKTYGIDITNWLMNPINLVESQLGPAGKMVTDVIGMMNGAARGYQDDINDNYEDFTNALKLYGGLATGVQAQKLSAFWRSINEHEAGIVQSPYPDRPFRIASSIGKLKNWVSYWDLLSYTCGFRPIEMTEDAKSISRAKEGLAKKQNAYGTAINALIQGDTRTFEQTVIDNQLDMSNLSSRLDSYNTELKQRVYEDLDPQLKLKYYRLFYPSND